MLLPTPDSSARLCWEKPRSSLSSRSLSGLLDALLVFIRSPMGEVPGLLPCAKQPMPSMLRDNSERILRKPKETAENYPIGGPIRLGSEYIEKPSLIGAVGAGKENMRHPVTYTTAAIATSFIGRHSHLGGGNLLGVRRSGRRRQRGGQAGPPPPPPPTPSSSPGKPSL